MTEQILNDDKCAYQALVWFKALRESHTRASIKIYIKLLAPRSSLSRYNKKQPIFGRCCRELPKTGQIFYNT